MTSGNSSLLRESFNYTEWQQNYFANHKLDDFLNKAQEFDKNNPFYENMTSEPPYSALL